MPYTNDVNQLIEQAISAYDLRLERLESSREQDIAFVRRQAKPIANTLSQEVDNED